MKMTKRNENRGEIVLYQPENSLKLEVLLENDTVWLSQMQMAELFQTTKQNVSLHISNVFKDGELKKNSVVKEYLTTADDGKNYKTEYYNLDVIISVGYRVRSKRGTQFRQWATAVLRDYLLKGHAISQRFERMEHRIVDDDVYHIGASFKDLGKKLFGFSKMLIKERDLLDTQTTKSCVDKLL